MKRILIITILALVSMMCNAGNSKNGITANALTDIISDFDGKDGFEVINVGKLGTYALKKMIRISADEDKEAESLLKIINGIKKVAIVDYKDCSSADREKFIRRIERVLNKENMIMEVHDDGETMKMYGVTDENSDSLSNFVLHAPSDGALICFFGTIPLKEITSALSR